jgi:hypothetical protein
LLIYTGSVFGIAVDFHYCDGHVTHVAMLNFGGGHGSCKCNPSDLPSGCCKHKILSMKGGDHKSSPAYLIALPDRFAIDVPVTHNNLSLPKEFFAIYDLAFYLVRRKSPQPLFLLNNVFRI